MEKTKKKGDVEFRKAFEDGFLKWALLLLIINSLCGKFIFETEMGFVNNDGFFVTFCVAAVATLGLSVFTLLKKKNNERLASLFELPLILFGLFLFGYVLFGSGHVYYTENGILAAFTHEVFRAGPPAVGGALPWVAVCVLAMLGNFFRTKTCKGVIGFTCGLAVAIVVEALLFRLVFIGELHMQMINGEQAKYHEMTRNINDWICGISGVLLALVCAYSAAKSLKKQEKIESKNK